MINAEFEADTVDFIPSKDDSIYRLMDHVADFEADQMIEDIIWIKQP